MTYPEVLANARECIGKYCKACPVCNGVACKNQIPGPGDRKSTRLNSSHIEESRMPSSA